MNKNLNDKNCLCIEKCQTCIKIHESLSHTHYKAIIANNMTLSGWDLTITEWQNE